MCSIMLQTCVVPTNQYIDYIMHSGFHNQENMVAWVPTGGLNAWLSEVALPPAD